MNTELVISPIEEIISITKEGSYITSHRKPIYLASDIERLRESTTTFTGSSNKLIYRDDLLTQDPLPFVTIEKGRMDTVIDFYLRDQNKSPANVTVTNFASGEKTNQDWLSDLTEEEELLASKSLVYASIYDKINEDNFAYKKLNGFYSYDVPVIIDKDNNMADPVYVDIITVQEVNKLVTTAYKALTQARKKEMSLRMQTLIEQYIQNAKINDLRDSVFIIGLYSCGPIGTFPIAIASRFETILKMNADFFKERNIRVDFALEDDEIINIFKKEFKLL